VVAAAFLRPEAVTPLGVLEFPVLLVVALVAPAKAGSDVARDESGCASGLSGLITLRGVSIDYLG